MKVIMICGSPRKEGNTSLALKEMENTFKAEGIESETFYIGAEAVRGCIACGACSKNGKCAFDDIVNKIGEKFKDADGIVMATPVYYASPNGSILSLADRLFHSTPYDKTMKVGASIAVARRGGCSAAFDALNKYYTISGMPVASSQYWNSVHGGAPGQAAEDKEGMQTLRTLAKNMAFLMKSIELGKEKFGLPEKEERQVTSFIR